MTSNNLADELNLVQMSAQVFHIISANKDNNPLQDACCNDGTPDCVCPPCMGKLQNTINYAFKLCGGIGLFFSFTEVVAAVIAYRYRNQFDPGDKAASAIINRQHSNHVY